MRYTIALTESVQLMDFISTLEKHLRTTANIKVIPIFVADGLRTMADTTTLKSDFGYQPAMLTDHGDCQFSDCYKTYYKIRNPK